jgi:xylan 1,4-beta-xylosidase
MDRRSFVRAAVLASGLTAWPTLAEAPPVDVSIETRQVTGPLPHVWSECAGSDRAAITLRESWRRDLDRWRSEAGLKRVRFHGIFSDELGVYAPSILNRRPDAPPNFQNVDRVYDGLLQHGVSPFVELSFMPKRLASGAGTFGFYGANTTPPKSNEEWAQFVRTFVVHLVERYGLNTVRTWPFEVWNEPDLPFFWTGNQQQYFDLYKATAVAIKSIDQGLQVGGPSTSKAAWIAEFSAFCGQNNAPCDFISTHTYSGDNQATLFGPGVQLPEADVIPETIRRARQKIDASALKGRPLWLTEWSSDSPAMMAHIIKGCLPHVHSMSHWTMSGTYEELGVADYVLKEGDIGFGTIMQGIARPSFNTYKLLHALGDRQLAGQGPVLASRRQGRSIVALVWNLADVKQPSGIPGQSHTRTVKGVTKRYQVEFKGARPGQQVRVRYVDQERGSPMPAWRAMGSPQYPTMQQIERLRQAAEIPPAQILRLDRAGRLTLTLPPEGVALVELV